MNGRTRALILGLLFGLAVAGPSHSQEAGRTPTSAAVPAQGGEQFRAEILEAVEAMMEVEALTGQRSSGLDLGLVSGRIAELDTDALAVVREAVVADIPDWDRRIWSLRGDIAAALAAARLEACTADLEFSPLCGAPSSTEVREVLLAAWEGFDIAALIAEGICDSSPTGCLCPVNAASCPVASVLKGIARGAQFLYTFAQFCADEGGGVTLDAVHCHLDDKSRFTDDMELTAQTDTLLTKMQEILDQLAGLQRATCDVSRLVTTPSGLRFSDIDVCQGEPGWPYDWPRNGVGVGSLGAEVVPATMSGALELEAHVTRGTLLPTLYLPAAAGGALEQVRDLVARTIASQERIGYAPGETAVARSVLQSGDRLAADRDYVGAYRGYSEAYRALIPAPDAAPATAPAVEGPSIAPEVELAPLGDARLPTQPTLGDVVPNPVSGTLRYSVRLPAEMLVTVRVYSVEGRLVRTLVDGSLPAGATELAWSSGSGGSRLASGVYFLRLDAAGLWESRKFVVTR